MMEAGDDVALVRSSKERDISVRERQVLTEYATGEDGIAGNITKAYQRVYPDANYNTASVAGSQLLRLPKAKQFLESLHREATELAAERLVPWVDLVPLAQGVIVATAQGRLRNRLAYEAAVYLVNRVIGTPVSSHEVHVRDDVRIAKAISAFAQRMRTATKIRDSNLVVRSDGDEVPASSQQGVDDPEFQGEEAR
jgi:hypothetical protein